MKFADVYDWRKMSRRTAPIRLSKREQIRKDMKVGNRHDENFDSLCEDKKRIPLPSPDELRRAEVITIAKMKEVFGPYGGQMIFKRVVVGED